MDATLTKRSRTGYGRAREIKRVLCIMIAFNLGVAAVKIFYGLFIHSTAMQADGIDSLFDGMGSAIGIIGMILASRPPDQGHPYGHGKFETYASLAIGVLLLAGAVRIGWEAVENLITGTAPVTVSALSYVVMGATIAVNFGISRYEGKKGRELGSEILSADARHTFMDVIVSLAVVAGLVLAQLGYPIADPIITLGVAVAILFTAWQVFRQGSHTLSDSTRIPEEEIHAIVDGCPKIAACHKIRTRGLPAEVYVDLHVLVAPDMTVLEAHTVADELETLIKERFPEVADITIHIEPDTPEERAEAE